MEMPFYADSAAEKDGDSIYWHRLPLAGFGAKSGYACRYGVFSTKSYPQECRNKSYLLRNKKGFIKFPAGEKLCRYMSEWLPEPYERVFAAASDGYEARRRKKERKRIEKKMKMMK